MPTPLEKFQILLRELFQFENTDLDFGIYRILNLRRKTVQAWIEAELPARAAEILQGRGTTADDDLAHRLDALRSQLLELDPGGIDEDGNIVNEALKGVAKGKEYLRLKTQTDLAPIHSASDLEVLVFNHLYDFFSRYYDSGDFVSKRRRSFASDGRDAYSIPWDGDEVVFHWANKDQHYIKTGERFTHYRWQSEVGARIFTIEFRLTDADLPIDNNKDAKNKFNLLVPNKVAWLENESTLVLPFHYRGLTPEEDAALSGTQEAKLREGVIRSTAKTLLQIPIILQVQDLGTALMAPKRDSSGQQVLDRDGNSIPLLSHHLNRWAVKNESDFFIHKNLRQYLSSELDYFLKTSVLGIDNLLAAGEHRAEPNFRLLEAIKRLGTEVIEFLSQLEDFQKSLFEKKKFVLETTWCITLDRIPPSVKNQVYTNILKNERQWQEWEELFKISKWTLGPTDPLPRTPEFLDAFPYLMLDTGLKNDDGSAAYDKNIQEALICAIDELDARTDGLVINSENYQALRFLEASYKNSVNAVYIDPPYNTDASPIIYKNGYRRSSWAALIADRVRLDWSLRVHPSVRCVAIDDFEYPDLQGLLEGLGERHHATASVRSKPQGRPTASGFSANHEYAVFWGDPSAKIGRLPRTGSKAERYPDSDD